MNNRATGPTSLHGSDETEGKALRWTGAAGHIDIPSMENMPNEQLWLLVRRFNKQVYHVKATPPRPFAGLDLNNSFEEPYTPDKLRSNVERLYTTLIIGLAAFAKHLARLRSWNETPRTAVFCTLYAVTWFHNLLFPMLLLIAILLILSPVSRDYFFPSLPLALVNSRTGLLQKPSAGLLGSHDSLTGASQKHQGEAVEQEAHNFVSSFAAISMSSITGNDPEDKTREEKSMIDMSIPDPTRVATRAADMRASAAGEKLVAGQDKTKHPVEKTMWVATRPAMYAVVEVADTWERCANALSPTAPFPKNSPRLRIVSLLLSVVALTVALIPFLTLKTLGFVGGMWLFGSPLLSRGSNLLDHAFPHWHELFRLQNNILHGVPTNAQLTLTLLRCGESNMTPLPPAPGPELPRTSDPASLEDFDTSMLGSPTETRNAINSEPSGIANDVETTGDDGAEEPKGLSRKLVGLVKDTTKSGVETVLFPDRLKASLGSRTAKRRLGTLRDPKAETLLGPVDFTARYEGQKGHVNISIKSKVPCLTFHPSPVGEGASFSLGSVSAPTTGPHRMDLLNKLDPRIDTSGDAATESALLCVPISDIAELKKVGGLGWKAKLIVGWGSDKEVADALEIVYNDGISVLLTALPLRDELFNRLVSIGAQEWESR